MKYLGIAYGKEFTQDECKVYYDFLQGYTYDSFRNAVKSLIKKTKFLPKINEIVDECENFKEHTKFEVIEFMHKQGYFKHPKEYDKAVMYMERKTIPSWFKEDLNRYYKLMKQDRLEHKEQLLLD